MNGTQKHKPDVDVVCVEPLGNSSQNPLRECGGTNQSLIYIYCKPL